MPQFHPEGYCRGLSGRNGNLTYEETVNGTIFFNFKMPADPNTPAQEVVRSDFRRATQTFATLPKAKVDAWNTYAKTLRTRNANDQMRSQRGLNVFVALTTKFLLVNPTGTIPQDPPGTPFYGDPLTVTATAGVGKITFTASGPNTPGVMTELLFQKLVNGNRKPGKSYKTGSYTTFIGGALSKDVAVPPGYYAAAYRFVKAATGQQSLLKPLAVTQVTLAVDKKAA